MSLTIWRGLAARGPAPLLRDGLPTAVAGPLGQDDDRGLPAPPADEAPAAIPAFGVDPWPQTVRALRNQVPLPHGLLDHGQDKLIGHERLHDLLDEEGVPARAILDQLG